MIYQELIENKPAKVAVLANELRKIILSSSSQLREIIYDGLMVKMAMYMFEPDQVVIVGLSVFDDHANFIVHHYNDVDTSGLTLTGEGGKAKNIRYYAIDEIPAARLTKLINDIISFIDIKNNETNITGF